MNELDILLSKHAHTAVQETCVPGLFLSNCLEDTLPEPYVLEPLLCGISRGRKRIYSQDHPYEYYPGTFLIAGLNMPVKSHVVEAPILGFTLMLDLVALRELIVEIDRAVLQDRESFSLAVHPLDGTLLEVITRLVRLLESPRDVVVMAPLIHKEVLYRLLLSDAGPMLSQLASPTSQLSRVGVAISTIRSRFAETLSTDELAQIAGLSVASFHRHFRLATKYSPLQFQKQIRLQEARRLLVATDQNANEAGFAVGYESASQFSREYRRAFGASPLEDSKRRRSASDVLP